jgi:hypothetical protein
MNIIQNQVGDYYIITSTNATQCSTNKNNSSSKVGLPIFLFQRTKIKVVVLLPGEMCDSDPPPPPHFSLGRLVTQAPSLRPL